MRGLRATIALAWFSCAVTAHAAERVFVLNAASWNVSIIDSATNTVTGTVPLGTGVFPRMAVAHPDGTRLYVGGNYSVFTIDPTTAAVTGSFDTYYPAQGLALNPTGTRLFVADAYSLNVHDAGPGNAYQYNRGISYLTQFMTRSPDGSRLYLNRSGIELHVFDTVARQTIPGVSVPGIVTAAVSPDGATIYVASVGTLYAVDAATMTVVNQQEIASRGFVAVSADGGTVYLARTGALIAVDPTTLAVTSEAPLSSDPSGIAVHPNMDRVYVTDAGLNTLGVFDGTTLAQTASIAVGQTPRVVVVGGCAGPAGDCDADGTADGTDNCPVNANASQADLDGDGDGDACDNCPNASDPGQVDSDFNGIGDACQDVDGDGVIDGADNCVLVPNPGQENADGDLHGDVCDVCPGADDAVDADFDGRADGCDNCPADYNPGQADGNSNNIGDACEDRDGDGLLDANDNCPDVVNPGQENDDFDQLGDVCDPCSDIDYDGFGNPGTPGNLCPDDNCPTYYNPDQVDLNPADGVGDACAICAPLGDAAYFGLLATEGVTYKTGAAYYNRYPIEIYNESDICARKVVGRGGDVIYDVVATEPLKRAASILDRPSGSYYEDAYVNSVITGGGDAQVSPYSAEFIDTTGTHPDVARCQSAKSDAVAASAYFASLPPTQTIEEIIVRTDAGDYFVDHDLVVGTNEVINVQRLMVTGKVGQWSCRRYADLNLDSTSTDPNNTLVINVFDQLKLGDCGHIHNYYFGAYDSVIINVVGPGKAVKLGQGANTDFAILAPERAVKVQGAQNFEEPTFTEPLWSRKLKMIAGVYANYYSYPSYGWCGIYPDYSLPQP